MWMKLEKKHKQTKGFSFTAENLLFYFVKIYSSAILLGTSVYLFFDHNQVTQKADSEKHITLLDNNRLEKC